MGSLNGKLVFWKGGSILAGESVFFSFLIIQRYLMIDKFHPVNVLPFFLLGKLVYSLVILCAGNGWKVQRYSKVVKVFEKPNVHKLDNSLYSSFHYPYMKIGLFFYGPSY